MTPDLTVRPAPARPAHRPRRHTWLPGRRRSSHGQGRPAPPGAGPPEPPSPDDTAGLAFDRPDDLTWPYLLVCVVPWLFWGAAICLAAHHVCVLCLPPLR